MSNPSHSIIRLVLGRTPLLMLLLASAAAAQNAEPLERIRISKDSPAFVTGEDDKRWIAWGVNYDHDRSGRLLDEYWGEDWQTVVDDFEEIKALGANCVRVHLQVGIFMDAPDQPNQQALDQLSRLVDLAEQNQLYLNITGLACYHKKNIPAWYDELSEQDRWDVQANFWRAVSRTCASSSNIFCYDLINEPILPGKEPESDWLAGELGGKYFVQRLALELRGRTREEIAEAWVKKMTDAIREHDRQHLITVGVIPWVFVFGGGKPLFYSSPVKQHLDFVSIHVYPRKGEVDKAVDALKSYEVGLPLVIEETFPLKCSEEELVEFIERSATTADGWFSFYWGATPQEIRRKEERSIGEAITASWLERFESLSDRAKSFRLDEASNRND